MGTITLEQAYNNLVLAARKAELKAEEHEAVAQSAVVIKSLIEKEIAAQQAVVVVEDETKNNGKND